MKIKKDYGIILQKNGYIICHNDIPIKNTITISCIGAYLWELLYERDLNTAQMLEALLNKFEISTVLALGEIDTFIKFLKENDILE